MESYNYYVKCVKSMESKILDTIDNISIDKIHDNQLNNQLKLQLDILTNTQLDIHWNKELYNSDLLGLFKTKRFANIYTYQIVTKDFYKKIIRFRTVCLIALSLKYLETEFKKIFNIDHTHTINHIKHYGKINIENDDTSNRQITIKENEISNSDIILVYTKNILLCDYSTLILFNVECASTNNVYLDNKLLDLQNTIFHKLEEQIKNPKQGLSKQEQDYYIKNNTNLIKSNMLSVDTLNQKSKDQTNINLIKSNTDLIKELDKRITRLSINLISTNGSHELVIENPYTYKKVIKEIVYIEKSLYSYDYEYMKNSRISLHKEFKATYNIIKRMCKYIPIAVPIQEKMV